jgi:GLPGLI family protein
MKIKKLIATIVLCYAIVPATAQKTFSEGRIIFSIEYPEAEIPDQHLAMLPTEMVMYVKKDKSRMEMSMGMGMSTVVIIDNKARTSTTLMDIMGNKMATRVTEEEVLKEYQNQKPIKVQHTDETREIAGYQCKKAIIIDSAGEESELFYCDQIRLDGGNWSHPHYKDINGLPLKYTTKEGGFKMHITAKKVIEEKVADSKFVIPSEYKIMTKEEIQRMFGGGQ